MERISMRLPPKRKNDRAEGGGSKKQGLRGKDKCAEGPSQERSSNFVI